MKIYRIILVPSGIEDSINDLIKDGYMPIGRQFKLYYAECQTICLVEESFRIDK